MKLFGISFVVILFFGCSSNPSLKVATSSNMKSAMVDIVNLFQEIHDVEIDIIDGASGKLASQIEFGAPYAIFVSADTKYPTYLYDSGLAVEKPKVYGSGELVLWSLKDIAPSLAILTTSKIKSIAVSNPKTAPYGQLTKDVLTDLGIYDSLYTKLVFGESIGQCDQYITSKSVDIGITSMASVKSKQMKGVGHWVEVGSNLYDFLPQSAVLVKTKITHPKAKLFYEFLFSDEVKVILRKYGYQVD
jgi:molybdate transport system substrate-binding protein